MPLLDFVLLTEELEKCQLGVDCSDPLKKQIEGTVAQLVKLATPGEELLGLIPAVAAAPAPYWLGHCQNNVTG